MNKAVESVPAIGISFQVGVSETKQIVFQCFVPMDCAPAEMNAALDKLRDASERQEAYVNLPKLKAKLAQFEKVQKRAVEDMYRLDQERVESQKAEYEAQSGGRRAVKADPQRVQRENKISAERSNAETTMGRATMEIEELKAEIEALEQKAG